MNRRKSKARSRDSRKPLRGKFAAAFEKGVKIVIHGAEGDRHLILRKHPEGGFLWKPDQAAADRHRKAT